MKLIRRGEMRFSKDTNDGRSISALAVGYSSKHIHDVYETEEAAEETLRCSQQKDKMKRNVHVRFIKSSSATMGPCIAGCATTLTSPAPQDLAEGRKATACCRLIKPRSSTTLVTIN